MNYPGMRPISIDDVTLHNNLAVDLYLKLSETKFVLVAKAGSQTQQEQMQKFREKKVLYLWVRNEDFFKTAQHAITVAGLVVNNPSVADEAKVAALSEATASVFLEAQKCRFNETTLAHSRMVVDATMVLSSSQPTLTSLVDSISKVGPDASRHAMAVSLVASMIGMAHGWVKAATLEKLALGGMLHDIGKVLLPPDLIHKPIFKLTKDELIIYRSHVEQGREMLQSLRTIPDDIVSIVFEHHELSDGSGYPRGLKDFQIAPLARVVCLANAFCEILDRRNMMGESSSVIRIVEELETARAGQFNRDAIRALRLISEDRLSEAV